jgi:hypothetical protein
LCEEGHFYKESISMETTLVLVLTDQSMPLLQTVNYNKCVIIVRVEVGFLFKIE